jgi:protein-L-isoaspartate(D-aspartate) O-methyltransferase
MDAKRIIGTRSKISIDSLIIWVVLLGAIGWADTLNIDDQRFARAKAALLKAIEADVSATSSFIGTDKLNPDVMRAMGSVRRHRFVPAAYVNQAYKNHPLPIGHGQTISQPYIVALMSNLLALHPGDRVLEVGTGSGYQAAILAEMGMNVYSIEIIRPLAETARQRLKDESYDKVHVTIGDGYFGWKQHAPFDAIIVTAATDHIPPPLLEQLQKGGKMVIPVGGQLSVQQLVLVTKGADGTVTTRQILPVRFVPLTRRP